MNTPLFMLRAVQLGISIGDMGLLTVGMVLDMAAESQNDSVEYPLKPTQADFDRF